MDAFYNKFERRTPHGVRGLKLPLRRGDTDRRSSHPARGAWIEIDRDKAALMGHTSSHPARGAWIEIAFAFAEVDLTGMSHPARGAWIEISITITC